MRRKNHTAIFIFILGLISSCTVPKEARRFEKETKEWREASIVLEGFADTPMRGSFLVLRENKKFERTTSGFIRSFSAGNWEITQDTIINLSYLDRENNVTRQQKAYINKEEATIMFEGETNSAIMVIITNKLYANDLDDE